MATTRFGDKQISSRILASLITRGRSPRLFNPNQTLDPASQTLTHSPRCQSSSRSSVQASVSALSSRRAHSSPSASKREREREREKERASAVLALARPTHYPVSGSIKHIFQRRISRSSASRKISLSAFPRRRPR